MTRAKGRSQGKKVLRRAPGSSGPAVLNVMKRLPAPSVSMMSGAGFRKTGGPTGIFISPTQVQEQVLGAIVGPITVFGPPVSYTFVIHDELENGSLWEVVSGILKLKDDQEVFFVDGDVRNLDITVTAPNGKSFTTVIAVSVVQAIIPPPPAFPPDDILLDNLTVPTNTLGAVVGNATAVDANLPDDTLTITVSDARFVVVMSNNFQGVLRLSPGQQINGSVEPTVTLTLRATDSTGLFVDKVFVIVVTGVAPVMGAFSDAFSPAFA